MDLEDKVAFITGGASGFGGATAERFIDAGAKVLIFDLNEELAKSTADALRKNAIHASGDVANEDQVSAAVAKAVDHFGTIHINLNSAGIGSAQRTVGS